MHSHARAWERDTDSGEEPIFLLNLVYSFTNSLFLVDRLYLCRQGIRLLGRITMIQLDRCKFQLNLAIYNIGLLSNQKEVNNG
jgi:hypothetical protein